MSTTIEASEASSSDARRSFTHIREPGPQYDFLVWAEGPGDEQPECFAVPAFDAVAAVAKVASMLTHATGDGPLREATLRAEQATPEVFYLTCTGCGQTDREVAPLCGYGDPTCPECLQEVIDDLIALGLLETRTRASGEVEYRATATGRRARENDDLARLCSLDAPARHARAASVGTAKQGTSVPDEVTQ